MWKRKGAKTDPCGVRLLRHRNLLRLPLAAVRVKLQLPTSSMIMRNMRLSGINRSNLQIQAALTAVTDVITESVWFIMVYCFLTVGSVKFCNYHL